MSAEPIPSGAALLSRYPADKIIVECDKCGMSAKYDKLEMLGAGGDRALTYLIEDIARHKGCTRVDLNNHKNRCDARYANIK